MEKELAVSKLRLFFIFPNVLNYYHIVGLKSSLKSETLPRSHKDSIEHHKKMFVHWITSIEISNCISKEMLIILPYSSMIYSIIHGI